MATSNRSRSRSRPDADSGSIPDAALAAAHDDIVAFAEELTRINGEPVDYSGPYRFWKEPLRAVVDPDTERVHAWKMGRGLGKTEQSTLPELYLSVTRRMHDALHAIPRSDQLNSYMKRTMARKVETSAGDPPILEAALESGSLAVKRNKFRSGSFLEGRSAWADGRSIQGFHGGFGAADEIQNWTPPAIANLKEAIDEGMSRILLTGTPDYEDTVYHQHWQSSTQHRWHYACPECATTQTVTLDSVAVIDTNPKRWGIHCRQCGQRLDKDTILAEGDWQATNPQGVHRGYTMSQLLSPRHDLDEIMRDRELPSTSKGDFYRYKLARFYSGGAKPIPEAAIYACCTDERSLHEAKVEDTPHFAGVDWGGGESAQTVVLVATVSDRDQKGFPTSLTIQTVERIDYDSRADELRQVADILDRFEVGADGRCVADLGYGSAHVESLQNGDARENPIPESGWGSNVIGHRFENVAEDAGSKWRYLAQDGRQVRAYQPPWANHVFDLFPEVQGYDETPSAGDIEDDYDVDRTPIKRIRIPYSNDTATQTRMQWWFPHLTAVKREFEETKSGKKKERITTFQDNQNDDGFYALTYCLTAMCLGAKTGGFVPHSVGGMTA